MIDSSFHRIVRFLKKICFPSEKEKKKKSSTREEEYEDREIDDGGRELERDRRSVDEEAERWDDKDARTLLARRKVGEEEIPAEWLSNEGGRDPG